MIVRDNGGEFTSTTILAWADRTRVNWHKTALGEPSAVQCGCFLAKGTERHARTMRARKPIRTMTHAMTPRATKVASGT